jgi:hypothetical protein
VNHQGLGGGLPGRLTAENSAAFVTSLSSLESQHWTSKELLAKVGKAYGVRYSLSHWTKYLREQLGLYYYKPSPVDYRKAQDADEQLLDRLQATFDGLRCLGRCPQEMSIGFADESAAQLFANNCRFWSLLPHLPRKVNTTRSSQSFFGFYALQGQSMLREMGGSEAEDFKELLLELKAGQPADKGIILIWDNATAHKAIDAWAYQQGIYLVYVPPYSPSLNPIERIWKQVKRYVNEKGWIENLTTLQQHFREGFDLYKSQRSFAEGWLEKMSEIFSWICPKDADVNPDDLANTVIMQI